MVTDHAADPSAFLFVAANEQETERLGQGLARVVPPGTTIALSGTLGAGKTRLVQALAQACQVPREEVLSPTFVLGQHYHGTRTLHHFDIYRLRDEDEFWELGPEEYFESSDITLVGWADRFPNVLPTDRLEIVIQVLGPTTRQFTLRGTGPSSQQVVEQLREIFQ